MKYLAIILSSLFGLSCVSAEPDISGASSASRSDFTGCAYEPQTVWPPEVGGLCCRPSEPTFTSVDGEDFACLPIDRLYHGWHRRVDCDRDFPGEGRCGFTIGSHRYGVARYTTNETEQTTDCAPHGYYQGREWDGHWDVCANGRWFVSEETVPFEPAIPPLNTVEDPDCDALIENVRAWNGSASFSFEASAGQNFVVSRRHAGVGDFVPVATVEASYGPTFWYSDVVASGETGSGDLFDYCIDHTIGMPIPPTEPAGPSCEFTAFNVQTWNGVASFEIDADAGQTLTLWRRPSGEEAYEEVRSITTTYGPSYWVRDEPEPGLAGVGGAYDYCVQAEASAEVRCDVLLEDIRSWDGRVSVSWEAEPGAAFDVRHRIRSASRWEAPSRIEASYGPTFWHSITVASGERGSGGSYDVCVTAR